MKIVNATALLPVLLLSACAVDPDAQTTEDGPGGGKSDSLLRDVGLRGVMFDEFEAKNVHVALGVGGWPWAAPVDWASSTVTSGEFGVHFPEAITDEFDFAVYIDVDASGTCGDGDVVWRDFYETSGSPMLVVTPDEVFTEEVPPPPDVYLEHVCGRFPQ